MKKVLIAVGVTMASLVGILVFGIIMLMTSSNSIYYDDYEGD
jgi:hypothetical protein